MINRKFNTRAAFTLIELLVVIAVIAILSAILLPVVNSVRKKSDLTQSVANARSIGQATLMYSQENDGEYPVWHDYNSGHYWWQALRPFLGHDDQVFRSPAHEEFDATDDTTLSETISYGWNYTVMGRHRGDTSRSGDHVLNQYILDPARTLVLTDSTKLQSFGYIDPTGHHADEERYGNKEATALFLDGRVEVLPIDVLKVEEPYFIGPRALPNTN